MKRIVLTVFAMLPALFALACPVCEKQQPEILRGITHGAGPEDRWDYVIVWTMIAIVLVTLFFSVKWLIRPGEGSGNHIKRVILSNE